MRGWWWVEAWMCGCVDAWMRGCVDAWRCVMGRNLFSRRRRPPTCLQLQGRLAHMPAMYKHMDAWGAILETCILRKTPPPGIEPGSSA